MRFSRINSLAGRRILIAVSSASLGGAENQVLSLARRLPEELDVELLCEPGGALEKLLGRTGRPLHLLSFRDNADLFALARFYLLLRKGRFDIVNLHMNRATLLGAIASRLAKVHAVATIHGMNRPLYSFFAGTIVACGKAVGRKLLADGADPAKVFVIPSSVDLEYIRKAARAVPVETGEKKNVILVVSRLHEKKGIDIAIKAFSRLVDEFPDLELNIAGGGDRKVLEKCQKLAAGLGVRGKVIFLGEREDVPLLIARSRLLALPSFQEGLPVSIMEAGALAKPVVASDIPGIAEIIENGVSGLLVRPGDEEAFASSFRLILKAPGFAEKLGRELERKVRENFSIERMILDYLSLFQHILTGQFSSSSPGAL